MKAYNELTDEQQQAAVDRCLSELLRHIISGAVRCSKITPQARESVVHQLCCRLKEDNPRFDIERFVAACCPQHLQRG